MLKGRRFTPSNPCPICGGHNRGVKGTGSRCYGYLSEDDAAAFCTRTELAGTLIEAGNSGAYAHKLRGECRCGSQHSPKLASPSQTRPTQPRNTVSWIIKDLAGDTVAEHTRLDYPDGAKAYYWTRDGKTGLHGMPSNELPLYGIHELPQPGDVVVVTEGEKPRDALVARGIAAVGTVCGAGSTPTDAVLRPLLGRSIILWADNDPIDSKGRRRGQDHMARIATRLLEAGSSPRIVIWPEAPEKGDAADYTGKNEDLLALLDAAVVYSPPLPVSNGSTPPGEHHLTDIGNARRLVARHGADFRYCFPFGHFLTWDTTRWARDNGETMMRWAKETVYSIYPEASLIYSQGTTLQGAGQPEASKQLRELAEATVKWGKSSEASPRLVAMIELAKSEPGIPVLPAQLDSDPWTLNVQNGTINLKTGELRTHQQADLLTKLAPVTYEPQAADETWDRFLADAIPDEETLAYLQRCAGASITGVQNDDLIILVHGPGGTGKSTFREALDAMLGEYSGVADIKTFTTADSPHSASPDLANLRGRRMVVVGEVTSGPAGSLGLLKQVTGGDKIQARFLFGQPFEYTPAFTLWLVGNERPRVSDTDSGIWRRMREIPFTAKVESPDPALRATLKHDPNARTAVLAWAVAGCRDWQRDGLGTVPERVLAATAEYRADMDPLADWLEDATVAAVGVFTFHRELLASYLEWSKTNGIRRPLGRKAFTQRLAEKFVPTRHTTGRGFVGLALGQIGNDVCETSLQAESQYDAQENPSHRESYGNKTSQTSLLANAQIDPQNVIPDRDQDDVSKIQTSSETSLAADPWDEDNHRSSL